MVLIVAALGLLILKEARRIRRLALVAADVVAEIDLNTRSVWSLTKTNETAEALLGGAAAIEENAKRIEGAVSAHQSEPA
ncbi:MAG: hypothetical protein AAGB11_12140 [Pseudomonadota bacterium]